MSLLSWDDQWRNLKLCWLKVRQKHRERDAALIALFYSILFILFAAIPLSYVFVIGNAQHYTTKPEYHEPAKTYSIELDALTRICRESELPPEVRNKHCDRSYEYIVNKAGFSDLAAQQTMASATTGLLWASWIGLIAGFFTIGLLIITFFVTRSMLVEASRTADAAADTLIQANLTTALTRETLEVTQRAEQPHLRLIFEVVSDNSHFIDERSFQQNYAGHDTETYRHHAKSHIVVKIRNYGQSAAFQVGININVESITGITPCKIEDLPVSKVDIAPGREHTHRVAYIRLPDFFGEERAHFFLEAWLSYINIFKASETTDRQIFHLTTSNDLQWHADRRREFFGPHTKDSQRGITQVRVGIDEIFFEMVTQQEYERVVRSIGRHPQLFPAGRSDNLG